MDVDRQRDFCQKLYERFAARPSVSLTLVDIYGCQQSEADSEQLRGYLSEMRYRFTQNEAEVDLIVINTYAIRGHAEMRVLGNVGALIHTKRAKPGQLICVCGYMVQEPRVAQKIEDSYRQVDLVLSPHTLWRFPELLYRLVTRRKRIFDTVDEPGSIAEGIPLVHQKGVKAWVSIMYGCNNFYTYCIVPYVWGRKRSRRPGIILDEIYGLVAEGCEDITLLGQNINSYGKDLDEPMDLAGLLRVASEIPSDFLLRFMTNHPRDASQKLFDAMTSSPKIVSCSHLPFQAGNDRILKTMNRVYDRAGYLDKVRRLCQAISGVVITSDVIVGFPGETAEEFEDTMTLIDEMRLDTLLTFTFSPREGTPAVKMDDPIPKAEKVAHFQRLVERQGQISEEKHAAYIGKTVRCLTDGQDGKGLTTRTPSNRLVRLAGGEGLIGQFMDVKITGANKWSLSEEPT